jgi:hypothetical protein
MSQTVSQEKEVIDLIEELPIDTLRTYFEEIMTEIVATEPTQEALSSQAAS